jgi:TPR repeat protein
LDRTKLIRFTCCGKTCHSVCQKNVMKSKMPDDLKHRCHQCRKPDPTTHEECLERLREWVGKGEAWAQGVMGEWYYHGKNGLKQSYVMASMLFEKAVAQGDPAAMYNLGVLYRDGKGVVQSSKKAFEYFTMAAEQGEVSAMFNLGTLYIQGQGVDQSNELAREWWTKAANEGDEDAINNLKILDEEETTTAAATSSTATTTTSASHCCAACNTPQTKDQKLNRCKCHSAYYCNSTCQRAHWGTHQEEHRRSVQEKTATKSARDTVKEETSTATTTTSPPPSPLPKKEGDNDKKDTTLRQSSTALASSPQQQNEEPDVCCICLDELSRDTCKLMRYICCGKTCCLECHNNVMKSKMPDNLKHRCHQCRKPSPTAKEAVERVREWVDKGEAWAQIMMGNWYRDDEHGVEQSYVMAAMLYEKAVAQGDPVAMYNLALLYRDGEGVEQSCKKSVELHTMAAEQGYVEAMLSLGVRYFQGQGVAQSNQLAREWWTKAANEGHENATKNLQILDEQEGKSTTNTAPTTTASPPPPPVCCSSCNTPQPSGHTFQKCKGCRTVQYCNTECQRAHWSPGGHKQECKRLRKKKEAKKGHEKGSSSQNKTSKST